MTLDKQRQHQRINVVNGLRLKIKPDCNSSYVRMCVEDSTRDVKVMVQRLGFDSDSLLLSGRDELSSVVETQSAESTWMPSLPLDSEQSLPIARLAPLTPRTTNSNSAQPAGLSFAVEADLTVIGPDLSRSQQEELGRGSRQSVVLINGSTLENSGPGSWPNVLKASSAVIATSEAARKLTGTANTDSAAKTMQNMSRGAMIMILDEKSLTYCARNQTRRMPIASSRTANQQQTRCVAAVATGLVSGCDAEQSAFAAAALIAGESKSSLPELIEAGRKIVTKSLVQRARSAESRRRARLLGAAAISAMLLVAVSLPWV